MMNTKLISNVGTKALGRAVLLGMVGAVLSGFMMVNTVTSSSLASNNVKLANETFADDGDLTVNKKGIIIVQTAVVAAGDSAPGVDVTLALPAVNNALVKNNYAYEFEIKEFANTSLQSAENLKIEVYGDDGSTTTLLATLYTQQSSVDDANIEGATVTVDLGSTTVLHNNFDIVVTRQ